ncbi:Uncharacterised protein [Mycobacterium tuberculosis]|uniref:Uncharacterized protein n=1 Tax=Mycobacterium tuberculosis TaxID=1773 RepID=A0A655IRK2_MYCTX|nr:Uncharacterised protein [Mycobacterium tuberculosis]CNL63249.1 Uncharacterised protein [Mycobacterium tuberculosis]COW12091.1 Uncharacterised protein [Mycobacterium tuberculosis]COZ31469.1 Uncharacterised protein [Mycobacterium tuberculosis]
MALSAFDWSRLRSMASKLSKVAEDTARPEVRSTNRLALQNPSRPSIWGRTDDL